MRAVHLILAAVWTLSLAGPVPAIAKPSAEAAVDPNAAGRLRALRGHRRSVPITIDGEIVEPDWSQAIPQTDFWQRDPREGEPPTQQTEFRVLYDDEALYVGVRAHDDQPDKIQGLLTRRDEDSPSDWIMVGVDSYHDRRTAFVFALNPAGVQRDALIYDDTAEDFTWNAVWSGAATVDDDGWTAEFRIPFSQLRFSSDDGDTTFGFQVVRVVQRSQEETFWSPTPKSKPQLVSVFGELNGLQDIPEARRAEILPYFLVGSQIEPADPLDPFRSGVDPVLNAGADFKYGLGTNLTFEGSINPDFGQVEADPSEVNLTAQETFFAEKRPLFLEGSDIFRFGLGQGDDQSEQLFYSRRIGAPPSVTPDADYVSSAPNTNIVGAAKLSGKLPGGWSIGVLNAVTSVEKARVQTGNQPPTDQVVEPLTNYSVLRLHKDLNGGATKLGVAYTGVHRNLSNTDISFLHTQAYGAGLSLSHRFWNDEWILNAKVIGSHVRGSKEAIAETQQRVGHYYQRPDADHLTFDPNRTSLSGVGAVADVWRMGGEHWRYALGTNTRTPGLELNDLGFQRDADSIVGWAWAQYHEDQPGALHQNYSVNVNLWNYGNYGTHLGSGGNVNANLTLPNYWGGHVGVGVEAPKWNNGLLRGGPTVRADTGYQYWGTLWTDSRKRIRLTAEYSGFTLPANGNWNGTIAPGLSVEPSSNLAFSLAPFIARNVNHDQYVTTVEDEAGDTRYILARVNQTTVGLTLRANYTVSPTLSIQFYAQPFASVGGYHDFKEPADLDADSYADRFHTFTSDELSLVGDTYGVDRTGDGTPELYFDRPDFNFREMRSNLILRWEFQPGSTAFLIWSHDRSDFDTLGEFAFNPEARALQHAGGANAVLFKLSYWWGL